MKLKLALGTVWWVSACAGVGANTPRKPTSSTVASAWSVRVMCQLLGR